MVDYCTRDYGFAACEEGSKLLIYPYVEHFLHQTTVQNYFASTLGCAKVFVGCAE